MTRYFRDADASLEPLVGQNGRHSGFWQPGPCPGPEPARQRSPGDCRQRRRRVRRARPHREFPNVFDRRSRRARGRAVVSDRRRDHARGLRPGHPSRPDNRQNYLLCLGLLHPVRADHVPFRRQRGHGRAAHHGRPGARHVSLRARLPVVHGRAPGRRRPGLAAMPGAGQRHRHPQAFRHPGVARDETESDLFTEQTLVPAIVAAVATAVEVLVDAGYPQAEALLELYLSGEMGDIMHEAAKKGLVGQTALHSPTSRYGTVSRLDRFKTPELRRIMEDALVGIRDGSFAREWAADQQNGYPQIPGVPTPVVRVPVRPRRTRGTGLSSRRPSRTARPILAATS